MLIAQFGSKTVTGHKPAWLANLVDQEVEQVPTAKTAWINAPWVNYGVDGYGADRAPMATSDTALQGYVHCGSRQTMDEFERSLRRYVGVKDYLIGYRYATCQCGMCGDCLRHCHVCGRERSVNWYAQRARLRDVAITDRAAYGFRDNNGTYQAKMTFAPDTSWQVMDTNRWAWGVLAGTRQAHFPEVDDTDFCNPQLVTEAHWPCDFPPCTPEPPFRFYLRPKSWIQRYCVGYWTAGRWIRAAIGGQAFVIVPGDTFPLSRMAFTNFSRLTVTVCSPTGYEYSFSVNRIVAEPQYLMIGPHVPPQVRYCPIHDDSCLDAVPATYTEIAQYGHAVPLDEATTPVVGQLWPGRNVIWFEGFRLPGHPFHWSYDVVPCFI